MLDELVSYVKTMRSHLGARATIKDIVITHLFKDFILTLLVLQIIGVS